jgi:probable rRNA maturation factor
MADTCAIRSTLSSFTVSPHDARLFRRIKNEILGGPFTLSVTFVGDARARTLNKRFRKKNTPTNVLSFPLGKTEGEIIINPHRAARDARAFKHTPREHCLFLFIHACLHLAGYTHGTTMEREERALLRRFSH